MSDETKEKTRVEVTMQSIQSGKLLAMVNEAIASVSDDTIERADIDKPRTVEIKIMITPDVIDQENGINQPKIKAVVRKSVPGETLTKTIGVVEGGKIKVNVNHSAEPLQEQMFNQNVVNLEK